MKVSKERIQNVLKQIVPDEDAERIIFYLRGKKNISEFIVAEELDQEIHETRKLLYKLLEHNVVEFERKKDKVKGWYICYWDLNKEMVPYLVEKIRKKKGKYSRIVVRDWVHPQRECKPQQDCKSALDSMTL